MGDGDIEFYQFLPAALAVRAFLAVDGSLSAGFEGFLQPALLLIAEGKTIPGGSVGVVVVDGFSI